MSAYIVSRKHIAYLLTAMQHRGICRHGFSYWNGTERVYVPAGDYAAAVEIGNILWQENIASVSARYPGETPDTLLGPVGETFELTTRDVTVFSDADPVQVLKACDCYEYQSCEHEGWHTSDAKKIIEALRGCAWRALPGYDSAAWGAPEKPRVPAHLVALN